MIELTGVSKKYKNGTHALYDVNLKVNDGEFVFVMGPTGSGKSTLVKLLDGEEVPTDGKVVVSGIDVGRLRKSKVYLYRRKIGVVFQDYRLLPEKTVFENVAYALEVLDMPTEKIRKRVRDVLKLVDLSDKSNSKPRELSGGQQQRVAIARAVAKKPMIIIADEPTGNLDPGMTDEMITLLEKINREEKTTILVVTHELTTVEKHPKRTIRIEKGHVVSDSIYKPKPVKPVVVEEVEPEPADSGLLFKGVENDEEDDVLEVTTPLEAKILSKEENIENVKETVEPIKEEKIEETVKENIEAAEAVNTQTAEEVKPETVEEVKPVEEKTDEEVKQETVSEAVVQPAVEAAANENVQKPETENKRPVIRETRMSRRKQREAMMQAENNVSQNETVSENSVQTENKETVETKQAETVNEVEPKVVFDDDEEYIIEDYTGASSVIADDKQDALNVLDEAVKEIANTVELFDIDKAQEKQ